MTQVVVSQILKLLKKKVVELEKNKSDVNKSDIYGERLKGRMGSNLLD